MPKVSIILPTYNGEKFIRQSIDSVITQTYQDWELIIVNDCSTDNTLKIISEYKNCDSRIKIINNEINCKLPKSLNIGFAQASGQYFTWTSDDNIFKPRAIEVMLNYLEQNPNVDLVSCKYDEIDEKGKVVNTIDKHNKRNLDRFLRRNIIGACFMYTKRIADKVGTYDENTFCAEDYDYWFRIALVGEIRFLHECHYQYRFNSNSLSSTKRDLVKKNILKVRENYVLKLMKKLKYGEYKIINTLIQLYLRDSSETVWLKMCLDINVKSFITIMLLNPEYIIKILLQKH